jgi:hypothetical protein
MNEFLARVAPYWQTFWGAFQFQLDFATAAIAVIAILIARRASHNQERLSVETLRVQRDNDLIKWTNGVIETLVGIEFLLRDWVRQPTQFLTKRDDYLAQLSAWIDKGRLYFPKFALDIIGPRTEAPPVDLTIPDRLVEIYDLIKGLDLHHPETIDKTRHELLLKKRAFMSHAQAEIDPHRRVRFLKGK